MFVDFRLIGERPLLMNAFAFDEADVGAQSSLWALRSDDRNRVTAGGLLDRLYCDKTHIAMPSENVMACLRSVLGDSSQVQAAFVPLWEFCDFLVDGKKIPIKPFRDVQCESFETQADLARSYGFRFWAKRARAGLNSVVRIRPRFDEWQIVGQMKVEDGLLDEKTIDHTFDLAGGHGLGDWRPSSSRPGGFGVFRSELQFS